MVEHYFDIITKVVIFFYAIWCGGISTTIYNRIPNEIPIGPTHKPRCNNCGNEIVFKYFFPVLGYFLSNGKCIKCGMKIPRIYLVLELSVLAYILLLSFTFDVFDEKFISKSLYGAFLITFLFIVLTHKQIKTRLIWMLTTFVIAYLGYCYKLPKALDLFSSGILSYGTLFLLSKMIYVEKNVFITCVILITSAGFIPSFIIALIGIALYFLYKTPVKKVLIKIKDIYLILLIVSFSILKTFFK